jgi:hypothetical protein
MKSFADPALLKLLYSETSFIGPPSGPGFGWTDIRGGPINQSGVFSCHEYMYVPHFIERIHGLYSVAHYFCSRKLAAEFDAQVSEVY